MDGAEQKELFMNELNYVFLFCAFYSGFVGFSLWLSLTEQIKVNAKLK